ncbi:hypothetical protein Glove_346g170 [Diversispora epigaea]|uniref:Uncharacterized protein n=1 Tax=Diversispora epigaea TaxID=1348612 RepID=A0A397HF01_9GLOM|nr:hypothetical protein Glove_346g170 [Diversispora epigaea]
MSSKTSSSNRPIPLKKGLFSCSKSSKKKSGVKVGPSESLNSAKVDCGIIYINVPSNVKDFCKAFRKAIEEHIPFTKQLKWKLRNIDHDAKDNVDNGKYIAVFVYSEGIILKRMESHSAWSQAKPMTEICDPSKEKLIEYLIYKRKIKKEAERLTELVVSRVMDHARQPFEVIKQKILTNVKRKFNSAKLFQDQSCHETGKHLINDLLKSKEINNDLFKKYLKMINADKFDVKLIDLTLDVNSNQATTSNQIDTKTK